MSNIQNTQKTLEVKVRPWADQKSQKGLARVHLSGEALHQLGGLKSGQKCCLSKIGTQDAPKEAIAWLSPEKSQNQKVILLSKAFQDASGFRLGDELLVCAGNNLDIAESVILRDISNDFLPTEVVLHEIEAKDLPGWEWFIGGHLNNAEEVYTGMILKNLPYPGQRRSFCVESVNGNANGVAKFNMERQPCSVKISTQVETIKLQNGDVSSLALDGIAGIDQALKKLNGFLGNFNRNVKPRYGQRSCGVLLHGGHGTGKTYITKKLVDTKWGKAHYIEPNAKAAAITETFKSAKLNQPSIIVIDELELIVSKDDTASHLNTKTLGQELDNLVLNHAGDSMPQVLVIATTSNPSDIPSSLKDERRFLTQIALSTPDAAARKMILRSLDPPLRPDQREEMLNKLGDRTHAFTGKDLNILLLTANTKMEERLEHPNPETEDVFIEQEDIEQALLEVRPTAMHDSTLQLPSVRWDEIGGQDSIKEALRHAVEAPLREPALMSRFGLTAKKGVLLYGPPGCSKTLSAQAMATEAGFNFFAVKGAELLNMYVGESERAVRNIFTRARAASPSIIFFDEIESIGSKRENGRNNGVNVLTTLLNEMDGIETLRGVMVLAATNQPQALDLALLRPGRFDKLLYVAPPDDAGREAIIRVRARKMVIAEDVDIAELANLTEGYSGAEIVGICQTAGDYAMAKCLSTGDRGLKAEMEDFKNAIKTVKKQITPELVLGYERWAAGARGDTD